MRTAMRRDQSPVAREWVQVASSRARSIASRTWIAACIAGSPVERGKIVSRPAHGARLHDLEEDDDHRHIAVLGMRELFGDLAGGVDHRDDDRGGVRVMDHARPVHEDLGRALGDRDRASAWTSVRTTIGET